MTQTLRDIQKSRTDFKKGGQDPKVARTAATVMNMKKETPLLKELINVTTKYHSLLTALSTTGQQLGEVLGKISKCHEGELELAVKTVADIHRYLDEGRGRIAEELMAKVIVPVSANYMEINKEAIQFEKEYKKKRDKSLSNIRNLEGRAKKAQKQAAKKPEVLNNTLTQLEEAVESHDKLLGESLREIRLIERKRTCVAIAGFAEMIGTEVEVLGVSWDELNSHRDNLKSIGGDTSNVGDTDEVIRTSKPSDTVNQLREARKTGYYNPDQMAYIQDQLKLSESQGPPVPMGGPPSPGGRGSPSLPPRGGGAPPIPTGGPPVPASGGGDYGGGDEYYEGEEYYEEEYYEEGGY